MIWSQLSEAKKILESGGVVGVPTETVYGLAGLVSSDEGLKKIFQIKQRPFFDPLIVHVGHMRQVKALVHAWMPTHERLAQAFWPGPLTLILKKSDAVSSLITAGLDQVGVRMPAHPVARRLAREAGAYAAPSANLFKKTSPTSAQHVRDDLGDTIFILDGGESMVGIESTVLFVDESSKQAEIYRPGMITAEALRDFFGPSWQVEHAQSPVAPGQLEEHYRPSKPLVVSLKSTLPKQKATLLKLAGQSGVSIQVELSPDVRLAARQLYGCLREASKQTGDYIDLILPIDRASQDWVSIFDRLKKASSVFMVEGI